MHLRDFAPRAIHNAVTALGPDLTGALVRDVSAPYLRFSGARHQTCLAAR